MILATLRPCKIPVKVWFVDGRLRQRRRREDADMLLKHIDAAAEIVDSANLTVDQERSKLQLVANVARRFWGWARRSR